MANPMARPTRTWSAARTTVAQESVRGADCLTTAASRQATIKANATFARAGIAIELKAGAALNSASVRRKGQKKSPSQRTRSASLTVSKVLPEERAYRHCRPFDVADHLPGRP